MKQPCDNEPCALVREMFKSDRGTLKLHTSLLLLILAGVLALWLKPLPGAGHYAGTMALPALKIVQQQEQGENSSLSQMR